MVFLTIKGPTSQDGVSRFEWEKQISKRDAEVLLPLCEDGMIEKIRYEIQSGDHIFEVDEFFGVNAGLVVAEVELKDLAENIVKPNWLGEEVTGQIRYFNSQLVKHPFKSWS